MNVASLPYAFSAPSGLLADPGNGGTITVNQIGRGQVPLVSVGPAETRTLSAPSVIGQELMLFMDTDAGDIVVTVNSGQGVSNITFDDAGDFAKLEAVSVAGAVKWRCIAYNGSTPA